MITNVIYLFFLIIDLFFPVRLEPVQNYNTDASPTYRTSLPLNQYNVYVVSN